jgi:hypothetical protein
VPTVKKLTCCQVIYKGFTEQWGFSLNIKELEQIENRARRGLPIDSEVILTLTAYLREVLQAKVNAEAVASQALKKAGIKSQYYTAKIRHEP